MLSSSVVARALTLRRVKGAQARKIALAVNDMAQWDPKPVNVVVAESVM